MGSLWEEWFNLTERKKVGRMRGGRVWRFGWMWGGRRWGGR